MISRRRAIIGVAAIVAATLAGSARSQGERVLTVMGNVQSPAAFTIDDLKKLPIRQVDDARAQGGPGGSQPRRYVGVLLRDVLDRAKLVEPQPRGLRRSIVIASARDGYKAVFSWAELYLSPIGDGVLVVYERDGVPLQAGEGPLALISLKDTSPGPRHVKWLEAIDVRMITD